MKQAVIDIGSNSMRLTVYDISNEHFKILFCEKDMAALAGYVENNILTQDGINRACVGLLDFKHTLKSIITTPKRRGMLSPYKGIVLR